MLKKETNSANQTEVNKPKSRFNQFNLVNLSDTEKQVLAFFAEIEGSFSKRLFLQISGIKEEDVDATFKKFNLQPQISEEDESEVYSALEAEKNILIRTLKYDTVEINTAISDNLSAGAPI